MEIIRFCPISSDSVIAPASHEPRVDLVVASTAHMFRAGPLALARHFAFTRVAPIRLVRLLAPFWVWSVPSVVWHAADGVVRLAEAVSCLPLLSARTTQKQRVAYAISHFRIKAMRFGQRVRRDVVAGPCSLQTCSYIRFSGQRSRSLF